MNKGRKWGGGRVGWWALGPALLAVCAVVVAEPPAWWITRGVIDANAVSHDYRVANQGQAKWFATNAYEEMQAMLPGGAGTGVAALVQGFSPSNNGAVLNIGQLKYVATPFYQRLMELGLTNAFPWTTHTTEDDADFMPALQGQLKTAFELVISALVDSDGDGLADEWELAVFGGLDWPYLSDLDGDGWDVMTECRYRTSPVAMDTDADGVPDFADSHPTLSSDIDNDGLPDDWEQLWFGAMMETGNDDPDHDGVSNGEELRNGTDPTLVNRVDAQLALTIFTPSWRRK